MPKCCMCKIADVAPGNEDCIDMCEVCEDAYWEENDRVAARITESCGEGLFDYTPEEEAELYAVWSANTVSL